MSLITWPMDLKFWLQTSKNRTPQKLLKNLPIGMLNVQQFTTYIQQFGNLIETRKLKHKVCNIITYICFQPTQVLVIIITISNSDEEAKQATSQSSLVKKCTSCIW
jgi:hypothetical protein